MKYTSINHSRGGFTFGEVLVAMGIITGFLATAFLVNARVLQNLKAQKETIAATQTFQERVEQIRSSSFSNLATTAYLQNTILNADAQSSASLPGATEVITVGVYPPDGSTSTQMTRQNGAVTVNSTSPVLTDPNQLKLVNLIRIDLQLTWTGLGGLSRSRRTSTIIGRGNTGF
jgi:type II secretory pathway pseudopilin PulG